MKYTARNNSSKVRLMLYGMGMFLALALCFTAVRVFAADDAPETKAHFLTVHDRGQQTTLVTDAPTVAEALAEAKIVLDSKDAVEPARDFELVGKEYDINIYRARPVTVIDGDLKLKIVSPYQSVSRIAQDAGITLYPEDTATLQRTEDLLSGGAGIVMTVDRATAFSFELYGSIVQARTQATDVRGVLTEKGIILDDQDKVSPAPETQVTSGMQVRVWREGVQLVTVQEPIAYDTVKIYDGDRPEGYVSVQKAGENGSKTVTYELIITNGVESSRKAIVSYVTKEPVSQQSIVGVKSVVRVVLTEQKIAIMAAAGISTSDQQYAAYIIDNENALWCAMRWQGSKSCATAYYQPFASAESSDQIGYGLCQSTPAIKMQSAGSDWRTNVATQMKWCQSYALGRYGSWEAAYRFKVARGWW